MKAELLKGLSDEQIAKVEARKGQEELLKVAKEKDTEPFDEQIEAVDSGCGTTPPCPAYASTSVERKQTFYVVEYTCRDCGIAW